MKAVLPLPYEDRGSLPGAVAGRLQAYLELTKPRVSVLVLLISLAGFWLGSKGRPDAGSLIAALWGIGLLAAGIFTLNQYIERDLDARMCRTAGRPLPTGRLQPGEALAFGVVLSVAAVACLAAAVSPAAGFLGLATLASYLFLYTPLKKRTPHCTLVGAFPGAVPPLLGWVAAGGEFGLEAWALFAILFLWQFPHFHSIAWLYRDDYARAKIRLWPVVEPEGTTTARQTVLFAALLLPASVLPVFLGISGQIYFCGALILGAYLLYRSVRAAARKSKGQAQRLLLASVLYLPALFLLMVLDKSAR